MIAFLLIVSTIGNVCSMSSNPKWATQLRNTFFNPPSPPTPPTPPTTSLSSVTESAINIEAPADLKPSGPILSRGLIDYIGNSTSFGADRWSKDDSIPFVPMTSRELFNTRFNLWRQLPWKKIKGKFVLKAKVSGEISLESASRGFSFGGSVDVEEIDSVTAITTMLFYGAQDPRVQALFVEFDRVGCGYAKLTELRRAMKYFRDSGKKIIGYCAGGAEKEFFLSLGCDEFFIPPDGGLDLRGFSGSATFVRGVFEKIGLEPQVQRIGKYKSFGDTFNRTSLSDAQREVISSLLVEASDFWADQVATRLDKPVDDVKDIWSQAGIKTPYQWADLGFVTGVSYLDQVEERVRLMYRREITSNPLQRALVSIFSKNATSVNVTAMLIKEQEESLTPFDLKTDFALHSRRSFSEVEPLNPYLNNTSDVVEEVDANDRMASAIRSKKESVKARFFPAGLYLRKMRKGFKIFPRLPYKESMGGPRIAVINAVGGISSGKSGSGAMGATLGSDTLISLVRSARYNPSIRAVVIRVDSPVRI